VTPNVQHPAQDFRERRLALEILRDSPTIRMARKLSGPWWRSDLEDAHKEQGDSNRIAVGARHYFAHRSKEEAEAARKASCKASRAAHEELARLYAELASNETKASTSSRH
jgi:hypothetical protein